MVTITILLLLSSAASHAQFGVTDGFNNGYVWERGSAQEKKMYISGIGDGIMLQSVSVAAESGKLNPPSLYPKGVIVTDVVGEMDALYQDRSNIRIPIIFSYMYVVRKMKGATQPELDDAIVKLRRQANR